MVSNPSYSQYVESIAKQFIQLSGVTTQFTPLVKPSGLSDQPRILILSPHPDDECLMAGCVLRMQEEWGAQVTVVPFSYGSNTTRRLNRSLELKEALQVLGFDFFDPRKNSGMDQLSQDEFMDAIKRIDPEIILSPHSKDFHPVHMATYSMVDDFLSAQKQGVHKKIVWIQTEYWQAAEKPNYFVPLSTENVIKIGSALLKHQGEIARNPYHLSLPAWYMDQARRAPEVMNSGFGANASTVVFGQLLQIF